MISGVQKALIFGWYPVNIFDIRVLNSVETWLFQQFFKFFTLWPLSTDIWLIFGYIQLTFFNILDEICQIFNWNLVNLLLIFVFIPVISGWYPWYPDIRLFPTRCYPLVSSIRTPTLIQGRLEITETNLMHFKWEATRTHRNQPNTF